MKIGGHGRDERPEQLKNGVTQARIINRKSDHILGERDSKQDGRISKYLPMNFSDNTGQGLNLRCHRLDTKPWKLHLTLLNQGFPVVK